MMINNGIDRIMGIRFNTVPYTCDRLRFDPETDRSKQPWGAGIDIAPAQCLQPKN